MSDEYQDAVIEAVQAVYAEEEDAAQDRIDRACAPTWWETGLTLIPYIGDLLDASCIAPEPPSLASIQQRADSAIARIEAQTGFDLDDETKASIVEDIRNIWGW
jgi:hypothetical protein